MRKLFIGVLLASCMSFLTGCAFHNFMMSLSPCNGLVGEEFEECMAIENDRIDSNIRWSDIANN